MNRRGFTLIEVIVSATVIGILLVTLSGFMASRIAQNAHQNARHDMLQETQLALDILMEDVRHSSNADDENRWPDEHAPDGEYSWESNESTLILARPATDDNNDFIYLDPHVYVPYKDNIIYFVEDQVLYKRVLAADTGSDGDNSATTTCPDGTTDCPADAELVHNVTAFEVRYLDEDGNDTVPSDARAIEAYLQLSDTVYGRDITTEYTTRAVFRN